MRGSKSWEENVNSMIGSMSDCYLTLTQFNNVVKDVMEYPLCPLRGLQYIVECPSPFKCFEVGQPISGDADVNTFQLQDNRDTSVRLKVWIKETPTSRPEKTYTLLTQLFKGFWKPELRTKTAGLLDLKRGRDAIILANKTVESTYATNRACSVLFSDLDNFKAANDLFGEIEGDRVIREFGALLEELAGNEAIILHNGGDEFVILRLGGTGETTVILAHEISKAIESHDFKVGDVKIGVSTGMAVAYPNTNTMVFDVLRAEAENALKKHVKKSKKGCARFLPGSNSRRKELKMDYRLDLAQCIMKSNLQSQHPFANVWLNCLSQVTCNTIQGKELKLDKIVSAFDDFRKWINADIVDISKIRSILPSELGLDIKDQLSPIDMAFALAHGLLRGAIVKGFKDSHNQSLVIKHDAKGQNCAVYIKKESVQKLIWNFGDGEKLVEKYDIGNFWISKLKPSRRLPQGARAMLIQIGHQNVRLPNCIFAEKIIVDDRPTRGGGLPDFWELTVSKVVTQILRNPNISVVYVMGNRKYAAKTVEKLLKISDWIGNSAEIAYKTALQENNIQEAALRLQSKVRFIRNKKELIVELAELLSYDHTLLPMEQIPVSTKSRFLKRDLDMQEMGLKEKDGCRVDTIAQAYPLVLQIARKTMDETAIKDQAGQELWELVDFKVYLQNPEQDMVPAFYEKDKNSLDEYYKRVFETESGFFGDKFRKTGQYDAVLRHLVDIIGDPQLQFATRRAILVVPHEICDPKDISPLGLVSVRIIPRFSRNFISLNYSYTWRTVEALVGFPYSLYGSVRFSQHLTEEIKKLGQPDVARQIHMGYVSYIAHSLHFFVDEHGQNIARRIIDDASI